MESIMPRKLHQGFFKPKNPKKYKGDVTNIFYRSGYELRVMKYLDENTNVLSWSADGLGANCEPTKKSGIAIPYISPVDNKVHRYYVDFYAEIRTITGVQTFLLEVKPQKEVVEPKKPKTVTKRYITEVMKYGINQAKWTSAEDYCRIKGWQFRVLTEAEIFGKKNK
jgi:hypothetical protein